jgi:hypothetical protein
MYKDRLVYGLNQGYTIDNDESFMIWVERGSDGKSFRERPEIPGSRGPIVKKAYADTEAKRVLQETVAVREYDRLRGIVDEINVRQSDLKIKRQMSDALANIKSATAEAASIDKHLSDAVDRANRLNEATAWLSDAGKALAIADLHNHIRDLLGPTGRQNIKNDPSKVPDPLKASSADEALVILRKWQQETSESIEVMKGRRSAVEEKIERHRKTIVEEATVLGAPDTVIHPR